MMGAIVHAVSVLILAPVAVITIGAAVLVFALDLKGELHDFAPDSRHNGTG